MQPAFPDGISEDHLDEPPRHTIHATWLGLLGLGAILAAALSGIFGGHSNDTLNQTANGVALSVSAPRTLRSGEFFEMRIALETSRRIAQPTLAISPGSLRGLTINTIMPAPAGEAFGKDAFLLEFDPLAPDDRLEVKIDGQSNPTLLGGTAGRLELRDGEAVLASVPLTIRVLP